MSKIWCVMIVISIVVSIALGSVGIVTNSITAQSQKAVENVIGLMGMMCFWSGIFKVLENTTVISKISKKMSKVIRLIFDKKSMSDEAEKYIALNITSNILGIGNAATVNGIKAMEELAKDSEPGVANDNMTKFVLINTASIQLLPTSMIALRTLYGSQNPTKIVIPVIVVTALSFISGIIAINILNKVIKEK